MPTLGSSPGAKFVKLLFLGDSGLGKTGALASLVKKLKKKLLILDFDNGLDILRNYLTPEELKSVYFETLTDPMRSVDGRVIPAGVPTAFSKGMNILTYGNIKGDGPEPIKLGEPSKLGDDWVLVIDSLTHCSRACYNWQLTLNADLKDKRMIYFHAQNQIRAMLAMLFSEAMQVHVVINAHVDYIEDVENTTLDSKGEKNIALKGRPMSVGSALGPEIPSYFNTVIRAKMQGQGASARRFIKSVPEGMVDLKNAMPSKIPEELPLSDGLATIFNILQGKQ